MKPKKKKSKWLKVTGMILSLLLVAGGAYGYTVYKSFKNAVDTTYKPVARKDSEKRVQRVEPVMVEKKNPFSVLMLGVDERKGDRGRSDTMIVLTVNPNNNSVKMLSIPRDTRTEIIGRDAEDKINHAYAYGGVPMAMDTVENFLNIPIDYYIKINMEGFKDIVDAVGGVTVQNDLDFKYGPYHFPNGKLKLNGDKALYFARMRHGDPRGDFGRQLRQREVIEAIIEEGTSLSTLTNFSDIFTALGKNVETNLTFSDMVDIQSKYREAGRTINQLQIEEKGTIIDSIYYGLVSSEEKLRVQNELRTQLELN